MKALLFLFLLPLIFISCKKLDVFERTVSLKGQNWNYNYHPAFTFRITDTSARYNILIVLRHTDAYKYNNIWIKTEMRSPVDSVQLQNIDVTLANDATGWEGKGVDDIFELRKHITPGPVKLKTPGDYTFTLSQVMRENPLGNIMNVGIRVEKVNF